MATSKKTVWRKGRAQDRTKIATGQEYEVSYEAGKTGTTPDAVKKAAREANSSRKIMEASLKVQRAMTHL